MTQVFDENGKILGVTVIEAGPCHVLSIKDKSIQLGFDTVQEKKLKKPVAGYFKKINIAGHKVIREFLKEPEKYLDKLPQFKK